MTKKITTKFLGNSSSKQAGFTIIESLIVLTIASLILLILFLVIPTIQRNSRNTLRKRDASMLHAAVLECLSMSLNNFQRCDEVSELPIDVSKFSIYTGAHFGAACTDWLASGCAQYPPTINEPNWLNYLICNNGSSLAPTPVSAKYVVGYFIETPGTPAVPPFVTAGISGRCID